MIVQSAPILQKAHELRPRYAPLAVFILIAGFSALIPLSVSSGELQDPKIEATEQDRDRFAELLVEKVQAKAKAQRTSIPFSAIAEGDGHKILRTTGPRPYMKRFAKLIQSSPEEKTRAWRAGFKRIVFNDGKSDFEVVDLEVDPSSSRTVGNTTALESQAIAQEVRVLHNVFGPIFHCTKENEWHGLRDPVTVESVTISPELLSQRLAVIKGNCSLRLKNNDHGRTITLVEWKLDVYTSTRKRRTKRQ